MQQTVTSNESGDGRFKMLCGAAILLFVFFVLSRQLDWATLQIDAAAGGQPGSTRAIDSSGAESWRALGTPLILCGLALIPINLFYLLTDRVLDPLAPAIANCVIAGVLLFATGYFIANVDSILGGTQGRSITLTYSAASGAYAALLISIFLLVVGFVQLWLRSRS